MDIVQGKIGELAILLLQNITFNINCNDSRNICIILLKNLVVCKQYRKITVWDDNSDELLYYLLKQKHFLAM